MKYLKYYEKQKLCCDFFGLDSHGCIDPCDISLAQWDRMSSLQSSHFVFELIVKHLSSDFVS